MTMQEGETVQVYGNREATVKQDHGASVTVEYGDGDVETLSKENVQS